MLKGEYEFNTNLKEIVTICSGSMMVQLPHSADWHTYKVGEQFEVSAKTKFQVSIPDDCAYLCEFIVA